MPMRPDADVDPTPMYWIISTRTYGLKIRYTTPGSESIDWRGEQIVQGRVRLGMSQLSDMVHNLGDEARRTLAALAMVDEESMSERLPRIPWSRIEEQHGESGLEHSFLSKPSNEWWVEAGKGWVEKRIVGSERQAAWITKPLNAQYAYRGKAISDYGRTVDVFREQIWTLMHMTGGQPARSTKILGLRMWNTMNGGVQKIFVQDGMIVS